MKALVKKKAEEGLWMEEVPQPEVAPHHVLVKVYRAGICGINTIYYGEILGGVGWEIWVWRASAQLIAHTTVRFWGVCAASA